MSSISSQMVLLTERLFSFALFFQMVELLKLRPLWSENGIWRWTTLRKEYTHCPWMRGGFDFLLNEKSFQLILWFGLGACALVFFKGGNAIALVFLFLYTWLIPIRWRGIFNGGSDSMTALIAFAVATRSCFPESLIVLKACLGYIAIQVTGSYFIAGIVKLKNREWRDGTALPIFFETPRYDSPAPWVNRFFSLPRYSVIGSWVLILFECTFPVAWIGPEVCLFYLGLAFVFHVLNFWTFGLNRFVWIWLAGYPAVFYWSQSRS